MKIDIRKLKENENNPRVITEENLQKLVDSLLIFPRMLDLRQIVVSKGEHLLLGGNMRHRAMTIILDLDRDDMLHRIWEGSKKRRKTQGEIEALIAYWDAWRGRPELDVVEADLEDEEQKEFIIKDNVSAGTWNYDMLQNFDQGDLRDWGLTDWLPAMDFGVDVDNDPVVSQDDRQRIIITFPKELTEKVYEMLGVKNEGRNSFKLEELIK